MKIAVASTKGGSGKTTSAMLIAAGLARHGSTLVIDADEQGSALSWGNRDEVELPYEVIHTKKLHINVPKFAEKFDHVVVDCPPGDIGIISRAIQSADHVILTAQPTPADLDKLLEVDELVTEWRDEETDLPTLHVLLTRVVKQSNQQFAVREIIERNMLEMFDTEIYNRVKISLTHGASIDDTDDLHGYEDVVAELMKIHKEAVNA